MPYSQLPASFWRNHLTIPLIIFSMMAISFEVSGIDIKLADIIYEWQGNSWVLKEAWITRNLIHDIGKVCSLMIAFIVLVAIAITYVCKQWMQYQRELLYLFCGSVGGASVIIILKNISHVSCAWDFTRYGGILPYTSVFTEIRGLSGGSCFPSGHASGGYAWFVFYFLGVHLNSKWRWAGLAFALSIGILFGFSQQLRGAHFISHDLWTLGICWFFSLGMYKLMLGAASAR